MMKIKRQEYKPNGNNANWKKPELKKLYGAFVKAFLQLDGSMISIIFGRMINCGKTKTMGIRKIRRRS